MQGHKATWSTSNHSTSILVITTSLREQATCTYTNFPPAAVHEIQLHSLGADCKSHVLFGSGFRVYIGFGLGFRVRVWVGA